MFYDIIGNRGREMFYLTTHSTHFIRKYKSRQLGFNVHIQSKLLQHTPGNTNIYIDILIFIC